MDGNNTSSPNDPLAEYAWHLKNTSQSTFSSSQGDVGYDLRMSSTFSSGVFGNGIRVLVSDSGVEGTHEDLRDNFSNINYNYRIPAPFISTQALPSNDIQEFGDPHGTMVAGIIAGVMDNNIGSRGVSPKAIVSSANFLATDVSRTREIVLNQVENDFDIINQSWGGPQCNIHLEDETYNDLVKLAGESFRNNKGAVIVKSAGNDYQINLWNPVIGCYGQEIIRVGNSNYDPKNNNPEITLAAAFNANGYAASYSSPGANIWVSAPGGESGADLWADGPAIITTDRIGCDYGHSGLLFYYLFDQDFDYFMNSFDGVSLNGEPYSSTLNPDCNYTASMNGTSSAAPMISGAVALLLEVNPSLTLRDVKHILASTAYELKDKPEYQVNPNVSSPAGHQWEQGWITNMAGYKFHNRYGFGAVHVDNAVSMAKNNYQLLPEQFRTIDEDDNWIYSSGSISLPIPDNSATGISHQIYVSHNFNIEAVQLRVTAAHTNLGDIGIELVSPGGTKSIISNINNSLDGLLNFSNNLFLSNAFYGEPSAGLWTIKLLDGKSGSTGSLTNWKINIIGNQKDVAPGPVVNLSTAGNWSSVSSSPIINWNPSLSSNISRYEYSLGTDVGLTDILAWQNNGLVTNVTVPGLNLTNGQTVYVNVRAVNSDGVSSIIKTTSWSVDTTGPLIYIAPPSLRLTKNTNVTYNLTYFGATSITLSASSIVLNKTGTANGVVSVSGSGSTSRLVTISSISGDGDLSISILSGSAEKNGSPASAAGPSISFTVKNSGPTISIGSPSLSITKNNIVSYIVSYVDASLITLTSSKIILNKTGTANGIVSVSGSGSTSRTLTITGITGDGTLGFSIASNTAVDTLGNIALSAGPSSAFNVDNTGPGITISSPSQSITSSASISYTVSYTDATLITLSSSNVTLNKTGTANGTVSVSGTGSSTRTVTVSGITGNGTLGISIASGTAVDSLGNLASSAGPSSTFTVDTIGPTLSISSPSSSITSSASISYTVSYIDAALVNLNSSNITLNKTGTANGVISVSGSGSSSRTVTISGITGNGSLGLSIASGTGSDFVGNLASSAGPSGTFIVDNAGPVLTISSPSKTVASSSVTYTITSNESATFNMTTSDVVLVTTGTASGSITVTGTGNSSRTVTISSLAGDGTIAISLLSNIAQDSLGNKSISTMASQAFTLGCESGSQTFNYSGSVQTFTLPIRCSSISFVAKGAAGGSGAIRSGDVFDSAMGSEGLGVNGKTSLLSGQVLNIYVGGKGANGSGDSNYRAAGAGGGSSAILVNSTSAVLIIAGGGAGGGVCPNELCNTVSAGKANTNSYSSTFLNSTLGGNGFGSSGTVALGGWGYRSGGKGGKSSGGSRAFGGGGAGNPGGSGGDGTATSDRGGNYYNNSLVTSFTNLTPAGEATGNGSITISWD